MSSLMGQPLPLGALGVLVSLGVHLCVCGLRHGQRANAHRPTGGGRGGGGRQRQSVRGETDREKGRGGARHRNRDRESNLQRKQLNKKDMDRETDREAMEGVQTEIELD